MTTSAQQRPLLPSSGRELLLDLKRSTQRGRLGSGASGSSSSASQIPILPTYNNKLVSQCVQDIQQTHEELRYKIAPYSDGNKPPFPARPAILLQNDCIHRLKRCLLAYHYQRMQIMQDIIRLKPQNTITANNDNDDIPMTTEETASTTTTATTTTSTTNISTNVHEVAFATDYAALREQYKQQVFELNMLPPTSPMLQVRVLKNVGQVILPDSGRSITMTKGSCLYLERADVIDFLQQGIVQIYDGEEIDF